MMSKQVTYTGNEAVKQLGISKQVLYFYRLNKVIIKGIDYIQGKTIFYNSSAISKIKEYREGNRIYKKSGTICNKRKSN